MQPSNGPNSVIPTTYIGDKFIWMPSELSKLKVSDRVLTRWPDDGWYYESVVRDMSSDGRYIVENKLGAVKYVHREDMIHQIPSNQVVDLKVGHNLVSKSDRLDFAFLIQQRSVIE